MNLKSSEILKEALELISTGQQLYACQAITQIENILGSTAGPTNAMYYFTKCALMLSPNRDSFLPWWEIGDQTRIATMQRAIIVAQEVND